MRGRLCALCDVPHPPGPGRVCGPAFALWLFAAALVASVVLASIVTALP